MHPGLLSPPKNTGRAGQPQSRAAPSGRVGTVRRPPNPAWRPHDAATGFMHNVTAEIFMDGDFDDDQRARVEEIAKRCPVHRTLEAGLVFDETVRF